MESGVLRGLLLCRLPFPVPTDPIIKARSNLCNNPFNDFQVPHAVLRFRQGFGRLIRSKVDRGAVVILDRRIQTANYGDRFLNALPPCTIREIQHRQRGGTGRPLVAVGPCSLTLVSPSTWPKAWRAGRPTAGVRWQDGGGGEGWYSGVLGRRLIHVRQRRGRRGVPGCRSRE